MKSSANLELFSLQLSSCSLKGHLSFLHTRPAQNMFIKTHPLPLSSFGWHYIILSFPSLRPRVFPESVPIVGSCSSSPHSDSSSSSGGSYSFDFPPRAQLKERGHCFLTNFCPVFVSPEAWPCNDGLFHVIILQRQQLCILARDTMAVWASP